MSVRLVALHGFLGRASDWDGLAGLLPGLTLDAWDLWQLLEGADAHDWASATAALDRALADAAAPADSTFLVAYSLGARLALGSRILSGPGSPVRGCCFVSCNTGFPDDDAAGREARRAADAEWARRIAEEPEAALWPAWDAQPVFEGGAAPLSRTGLPAAREVLARALTACSLAGQPDLRPALRAWPTPVLWVTGARDRKFTAIASALREGAPAVEFVTCEEAGHRVPWDNAPAFAAALRRWIARVMESDR